MRSFSCGVPRRIELSSLYTSNARSTSTPQTATLPSYSSAGSSPLGTLGPSSPSMGIHAAHAPLSSAPHTITSFHNPYFARDDGARTPDSVAGSHHDPHSHFAPMPPGIINGANREGDMSMTGSPVGSPADDSMAVHDGLHIPTSVFELA